MTSRSLASAVGASGFFTLAVGATAGSGWVVVVGTWITHAGPAGAALGFAAGAVTMISVALCYGELAARYGRAGGEFFYVYQIFGRFPSFLVGWFLTLFAVAVCAFEAVVLGTLVRSLSSKATTTPLYVIRGAPIYGDALLLGIAGAFLFGYVHTLGAHVAIRFQNIVTYVFLILMLIAVVAGVTFLDPNNLSPVFRSPEGTSWTLGALSVFATCAFFLNGWQTALHALEERRADVDVNIAMRSIIVGIAVAALIYIGIITAIAGAIPAHLLANAQMPVQEAFNALSPRLHLGTLLLSAAVVSTAKTWSATVWVGSRLIVAQSRAGFLPASLSRLDAQNMAPKRAIAVMTGLSILGPLAGRGALLPIVTMVAICLALSIIVCLSALVRWRQRETSPSGYRVPGGSFTIGFAFVAAATMIGIGLLTPFFDNPGQFPLEWQLLLGWGFLGCLFFYATRRAAA